MKSGIADLLDRLHHLVEMEGRLEWLDLLHQRIRYALAGDERNSRDVVDRLFRIELGTLAADLVEDVDKMHFHIEQAQFENGKQPARARANDQHVGFDRFAHIVSFRLDRTARRPFWLRLSSQQGTGRKAIIWWQDSAATSCRRSITAL